MCHNSCTIRSEKVASTTPKLYIKYNWGSNTVVMSPLGPISLSKADLNARLVSNLILLNQYKLKPGRKQLSGKDALRPSPTWLQQNNGQKDLAHYDLTWKSFMMFLLRAARNREATDCFPENKSTTEVSWATGW